MAGDGSITSSATATLARTHQGPPGYVHGGIIATMLDEAMAKLNYPLGVTAMTRNLEVDYLRPAPIDMELTIVARHIRREGRKIFHSAQVLGHTGKVLAEAKGLFIVVDLSHLALKPSEPR